MNREKFTVFHYDEHTGCYKRLALVSGRWFNRQGTVRSQRGEYRANTCVLRIYDSLPEVSEGDYVMRGNIAELCKAEALAIKTVTQNRQGSPRVNHVRLDCV